MISKELVEESLRWRRLISIILGGARGGEKCRVPEPEALPPPGDPGVHAAVDGGSKIVEYEEFSFYVARAWAGLFPPKTRPSTAASVGLVVPPEEPDVQVGYFREILEAHAALGIIAQGPRMILMDGSITGPLRWYRPGFGERLRLHEALGEAEEAARWLAENHGGEVAWALGVEPRCRGPGRYPCLEYLLRESRRRPVSSRLAMLSEALHSPGGADWAPAVEVAEKLYLYKRLLEEAWSRGALVVFVSKTVRRRRICSDMPHSDQYYVKKAMTGRTGYITWPDALRVGYANIMGLRVEGGFLPRLLGIPEFYSRRLGNIEAYVSFSPRGPILHVDVVFDAPSTGDPEGLLEEALSLLRGAGLSRGYPVSLSVAHRHARVLEEEARIYAGAMGFEALRASRSMLGV